ncbi:MAG: polysaccharide biosynthesis protein [Clostridiales bacterium]|nr:polysaccharide biosynthesis protein [Clostridiales bacterium]
MGEKKASFVKQAAILAAAGLIVRFIGFVYRLPLTNLIGDNGNAIYSNGYYLYTFFLVLSSAGMPAAISKMVSSRITLNQHRNAHMVFRVAMAVAVSMGLAGTLILGFGARFLSEITKNPYSYYSILTLSPTVSIVAVMSVYRGYFQGMHSTVPTAISQIVEQVVNAVSSVLLAALLVKQGIEFGAAGGTAGTGIGALAGCVCLFFMYRLARPLILKKFRHDRDYEGFESVGAIASELLRTSLPIIAGTAVFSFSNLIDMTMVYHRLESIGMAHSQAELLYGQLTGKYVLLTTLPVSVATALATAVVPNVAASVTLKNTTAVHQKTNTALRLTMLFSVPAAMGIGVLSNQILALLFPRYRDGGDLLRIGAVSIVFLALAQISTGILQGIGRIKIPALAAMCGALVKIPLNYVLIAIPDLNIKGAVISTIACYVVASLIDLGMLSRTMYVKPDLAGVLLKPALSAGVMGLCTYVTYYVVYYMLPVNAVALLAAIVISIAVYIGMLVMLKGLHRSDMLALPYGRKIVAVMERYHMLK